MGLDFTISKIAPNTGKIVPSQNLVLIANGHPAFLDGRAHEGDGWHAQCRGAMERTGVVADENPAVRQD